MTNLQLLEAIGMIDEETVYDAEQPAEKPIPILRRRAMRQLSALAACLCLIVGGAILAHLGGWGIAENGFSASGNDGAATMSPGNGGALAGDTPTEGKTEAINPDGETTNAGAIGGDATDATSTVTQSEGPTICYGTPPEGELIYSQSFDNFADTSLDIGVPAELGWSTLTAEQNGVYSESDVAFAIRDGRLYFDNLDTAEDSLADDSRFAALSLTRGKNAYYAIDPLNDEYMMPYVMGKYTLEYDLEYLAAADTDSYAALITELTEDGQAYNVFGFRINGRATHQCHYYAAWKTYSAYDPATDLNPAADDPAGTEGTPLLQKLLGLDVATHGDKANFAGVTVTIRLQWDLEIGGHNVFMKTKHMEHFVQVSAPNPNAKAPMYVGWDGYTVAFKVCGATEGYLDNIRLWTGWSDEPDPIEEKRELTALNALSDAAITTDGTAFTAEEIDGVLNEWEETYRASLAFEGIPAESIVFHKTGYYHIQTDGTSNVLDYHYLTLPVTAGDEVVGQITLFRTAGEVDSTFVYSGNLFRHLTRLLQAHPGEKLVLIRRPGISASVITPDNTLYELTGEEPMVAKTLSGDYYRIYKTDFNTISDNILK